MLAMSASDDVSRPCDPPDLPPFPARVTSPFRFRSAMDQSLTRFTLFVSIFHLVFGGAFIYFTLFLSTSVVASIASNLGFLFILWIFWLAS